MVDKIIIIPRTNDKPVKIFYESTCVEEFTEEDLINFYVQLIDRVSTTNENLDK